MYCVLLCDRPYLQLLDPDFFTHYKKYFVGLGAFTKCKLCYVEIFPNKEGKFT